MTISTYIIIGVIFMFSFEYFLKSEKVKKNINLRVKDFDIFERVIGILLWPLYLGVFLYNFFKELLK
jgi:predicted Na+-dependent transporter